MTVYLQVVILAPPKTLHPGSGPTASSGVFRINRFNPEVWPRTHKTILVQFLVDLKEYTNKYPTRIGSIAKQAVNRVLQIGITVAGHRYKYATHDAHADGGSGAPLARGLQRSDQAGNSLGIVIALQGYLLHFMTVFVLNMDMGVFANDL